MITIRLSGAEDVQAAREIVQRADPDLYVEDGAGGKSLVVRMTEAQIQARQDFAIDQNLTTLRNRVNQLGVAEPAGDVGNRVAPAGSGRSGRSTDTVTGGRTVGGAQSVFHERRHGLPELPRLRAHRWIEDHRPS